MKTGKRYISRDMLSVEENGKWILISTHRQKIVVAFGTGHDGKDARQLYYTFSELFELLKRLNDNENE